MLETAQHCFTSARCEGDGDEERWLIRCRQGKVAEKQRQPPRCTCGTTPAGQPPPARGGARYPKRSTTQPPELAMEALGEAALAAGWGWAHAPETGLPATRGTVCAPAPAAVPFRVLTVLLGASAPSTAALGPCTCSLLPRCSGGGIGSQLGDGSRGRDPLDIPGSQSRMLTPEQTVCLPGCARVGSGGMLGVLLAHTWSTAGSRTRCRPGGSWLPGTWGLSASALCRPRVHPTIPLPESRWEFGASLRVYSFFVFTYLLLLIVNDH